MSIDKLKEADWNPKDYPGEFLKRLEASILYEGAYGVLAVRKLDDDSYEVIDGNHRLRVLRRLGYEEVYVEDFGEIDFNTAYLIFWQRNQLWNPINYEELFKLTNKYEIKLNDVTITVPVPTPVNMDFDKVMTWKEQFLRLVVIVPDDIYQKLLLKGNPSDVILGILEKAYLEEVKDGRRDN